MKFYKAFLDTQNFTFSAFGETSEIAHKALIDGLRDHARQYGLSYSWFSLYRNDISIIDLEMNKAYRDNERIG